MCTMIITSRTYIRLLYSEKNYALVGVLLRSYSSLHEFTNYQWCYAFDSLQAQCCEYAIAITFQMPNKEQAQLWPTLVSIKHLVARNVPRMNSPYHRVVRLRISATRSCERESAAASGVIPSADFFTGSQPNFKRGANTLRISHFQAHMFSYL